MFIPTAHSDVCKSVAVDAAAIDAPILEARCVTVRFGDLVANDPVTLRVYAGEVWADPSRNLSRSLGQVKRCKGSVRPRWLRACAMAVVRSIPNCAAELGDGYTISAQTLRLASHCSAR